jgi:hypothetical protein
MIVDSGTPIHIVYDHLFVSNTGEDYTPVAGFSGNASRATHRGDLNARVSGVVAGDRDVVAFDVRELVGL